MVAMVAVPKNRRGAASLPPWKRVYDREQRARLMAGKVDSMGTIICNGVPAGQNVIV